MSLRLQIIQQIRDITLNLMRTGFSIKENMVADRQNEISWSGFQNISFALRNLPYDQIYTQCILEGAYNFILLDNALIQIMYRVDGDKIVSHRLAYLPHPNFLNYQEDPDIFEELVYGNQFFTDIIEKKVVATPIRFDFNSDDKQHVEFDHPKSHLTIGNYQNCRIPVSKPISPNRFIQFILRSFYLERFKSVFDNAEFHCDLQIEKTITEAELVQIHLSA